MWFGPKPKRPETRREVLTGEAYDPMWFPANLPGGGLALMTLVDVRLIWHGREMATKAAVATWVDDELYAVRIVNADGSNRWITPVGSPAIWRACYEAGRCKSSGEV